MPSEFRGVSRGRLQLLAADPRQRPGGALGRQGGQLGQGLRQRPGHARERRPSASSRCSARSPGSRTSACSTILGQPNLQILIDRRACARYGINVADVEEVVQVAIGGRAFSAMVEGEKLFDIVLRLPEDRRDDPTAIGRIPIDVPAAEGAGVRRIPLAQVATIAPHTPGGDHDLSREQPPLHPGQLQRRGPRPRLDDRRGPAAGRPPPASCPRATRSSGPASSSRCRRPTPGSSGSSRSRSA